jgi:hypothetical protein
MQDDVRWVNLGELPQADRARLARVQALAAAAMAAAGAERVSDKREEVDRET